MTVTVEQLEALMRGEEDETLEFKEARNNYDFNKLAAYCVALANEGGGKFILGVTDTVPRTVCGTNVFRSPGRTKSDIMQRINHRVEVEVVTHPDGRVLVFDIPSHLIGTPVHDRGTYWMRVGEELKPMTPERIKRILDEAVVDFSSVVCPGTSIADLDPDAINTFRQLWSTKARNPAILRRSNEQILADAELIENHRVNYAGLILLGKEEALGRLMPQAEVVYEYRNDQAMTPFSQRIDFRKGFFLYYEDLWENITGRNDEYQIQAGMFQHSIPVFNETVVREAVLNAISHRDYRFPQSIFIQQTPLQLLVVNPGGFPEGITTENIMYNQNPRNRRIAETFQKCGLVERSGQGFDRIYELLIRESKSLPDFTHTDQYKVSICFNGEVQDENFVRFLNEIGQETLATFNVEDFLVLDLVNKGETIPEILSRRLNHLRENGIIERTGRGRGVRYLLSRRYYQYIGQPGKYTRQRGLDKETHKALLEQHIKDNPGSKLNQLKQVIPELSDDQVKKRLQELKVEEKVHVKGKTSAAQWHPGSGDD